MAYPLDADSKAILRPPLRPVLVRARITNPPAIVSDSYLGGFARAHRFTYSDEKHFVWWAETILPRASFSNAFASAFEGGAGSPMGSGFASAFSSAFR